MPIVRFIEGAGRDAGGAGAAVFDPEVVALLGVAIELLDTQLVVPGIARLVAELVGGFESVAAVLVFRKRKAMSAFRVGLR